MMSAFQSAMLKWRARVRFSLSAPVLMLAAATFSYVASFGWTILVGSQNTFPAALAGMALAICLTAALLYNAYRRAQLVAVVDVLKEQCAWMSHEYRNSAARMALHLLPVREEIDRLTAKSHLALSEFERERDSMSRSSQAILELARTKLLGFGFGANLRESRELNLASLVEEAIELVEGKAQKKKIELRASLSDARIRGNDAMIAMMALNLIENAVKYTPAESDGFVEIICRTQGSTIFLCIADNGPGIPPEMREQVFIAGQRLAQTESEQGSGFGLALVLEIVLLHKGTIMVVESEAGGADFRLEFPAFK